MAKKKEIRKTIENFRTSRGMTQTDLAALVNVSPSRVSEWESGATEPSAESYARLAGLAARTDPDVAFLFWSAAGLSEDAAESIANLVLKRDGANNPAAVNLLSTAGEILKARVVDVRAESKKGNVVIIREYPGDRSPAQESLPQVTVDAWKVPNPASTLYIWARQKRAEDKVGHGVAPEDIIVFDRHGVKGENYHAFMGEKVVMEFEDGFFVGRLGWLGEGTIRHLAIGPIDELPDAWALGVTPHLRIIWSSGIHPNPEERPHRKVHEVRRFLGVWIDQSDGGAPDYWKTRARAAAPREK